MGDVDYIKQSCWLSLQAILKKHTGVLSTNEYSEMMRGDQKVDAKVRAIVRLRGFPVPYILTCC